MITSLTVLSSPGPVATPLLVSNLSFTQTAASATITPSNGTGITIPAASSGLGGLAGLLDSARATVIDNLSSVAGNGLFSSLVGAPYQPWSPNFVIDGGGSVITTGIKGFIQVGIGTLLGTLPNVGTVTLNSWALMADQVGSIAIDIWKLSSVTGFPPTIVNSIVAGNGPTLASQQYNSNNIVLAPSTGAWSTNVLENGDVLAFNVTAISVCQRVTLFLNGTHS